ncbi:hypothetical protein GCM10010124_26280 [Pilimelia terevasa]|uniref:TNase-like domain-containing protein n=1 Tax=Pilimelia terevasa TaxID=53372 RepID=A0A8J3BR57_9ACTN|nr:thermonuclease family protein [Pilimelia terevasa]GGK32249.1 hypothetical protein GCM10010124_26280 [Pilimelia terevasa]
MTTWIYPRSKVIRVVDADTIEVDANQGLRNKRGIEVRLAEVDAPERNTAAGKTAKAFVEALLPSGTEVTVVSHEIYSFTRVIGEVRLADGQSLGDVLIRHGHAVRYDGGPRG